MTPARLIAYAIGALALMGLIAFTLFTINGWRQDAARLAAVTLERNQAISARDALDASMTAQMQAMATRIQNLTQRIAQFEADNAATGKTIDAAMARYLDILRRNPRANTSDPGRDQRVRNGLRQLLEIPPGAKPRADAGGGNRQSAAGLPAAPAQRAAMPGGQRAGSGDERGRHDGVSLSPAVFLGIGAGKRASRHGRRGRGGDHGLAQGSEPSLPDTGLHGEPPVLRTLARAALNLLASAASLFIRTAQDDGR